MKIVLHRLSDVCPCSQDQEEKDSVRRSMLTMNSRERGARILLEAGACYAAMRRFRDDRERNKRYTYGDQWGDIVCVDGERMTEEEYIRRQGSIPLKTNVIRRLVRNVIGVYRSQSNEPTCVARDRNEQGEAETMSTVLQYNMQLNRMGEVYARTFEEYVISGFAVHRKWYGWRHGRMDCWTDYVQPNNFFADAGMRDFRGWDCTIVGEIHDVSFGTLCEQFATSSSDYARLSDIYRMARDGDYRKQYWKDFGYGDDIQHNDFLTPHDDGLCRVIEVWRKESRPRYRCHDLNTGEVFKVDVDDFDAVVASENERRLEQAQQAGMSLSEVPLINAEWFMDSYWYFYYLSPMGDILSEGETPYAHGSHPYVFKAYPFIDGEIHSFVSDIIDQQRYTNRLITLNDWVIRSSAKGVLMIPEDSVPAGMTPDDFADAWTRYNGVIVFRPSKSGAIPHQISSNATNIGIHEMLSLQMRMLEEISGVNGALQGKTGYSGMSAALYSQQTQNATTSLLDMLDSFQEFVKDAAYKDVQNIQQFYDDVRVVNIAGRKSGSTVYDPKAMRDVEMDISIVPSTTTPAYRTIANDFLMQLFNLHAISIEQLLEAGNFPFADSLLQSIRVQKQQMADEQKAALQMDGVQSGNGQAPEVMAGEASGMASQVAYTRSAAMLSRALGKG